MIRIVHGKQCLRIVCTWCCDLLRKYSNINHVQATSRHKTDKHEAMRKEEEKVRTKVNKMLNVILLTNKLQHDKKVGTHLIGHFKVPLCLVWNLSYENELLFYVQFHFHANQSHFHKNGLALRLVLKQRHKGTWNSVHGEVDKGQVCIQTKWPTRPELIAVSVAGSN